MSKKPTQVRPQARDLPSVRENEGARVPVILSTAANVNGVSVQTAQVKLGEAPVPERKYVADLCDIDVSSGTVRLLFGQRKIGSEDLRSLLVIQMTTLGAARFLNSFDQLVPMSIAKMAQQYDLKSEPMTKITSEPAQTVALAAALALVAATPDGATVDFYQASAFAFSSVTQLKSISLDPVVRVDVRPQLLLGLVDGLYALNLPKEFSTEFSK